MTKEEKLNYINNIILNKETKYHGPATLFKYRSFNQYTFDMLENNYLFLCPAEKLDDETECTTTLELKNLYDYERDGLKRECVLQMVSLIKPYTSEKNYKQIESIIYPLINANGTVRNNFLLDSIHELQELAPDFDMVSLFNCLTGIPSQLDKPEIRSQIEELIGAALVAREKMGVCSLSEDGNNEDLWHRYGGDGSGYCIEYDMNNYSVVDSIFPVIYEDERETNIVVSIIGNFIGQTIRKISRGQIEPDVSQFLRLFISKYKEWECQNEWRILGNANDKIQAPIIKRIILGSKVSEENKKAIIEYCLKNNVLCENNL